MRELLHLGPRELRRDRHDDMQPLAAGRLQERAELHAFDDRARHLGCPHELLPGKIFVGIEIERDAIGVLHIGHARAPGV